MPTKIFLNVKFLGFSNLVSFWIGKRGSTFEFPSLFFFPAAYFDFSIVNNASMHCSRIPQTSLFSNFFIKNRSHGTSHTFKNYFVTMFSIFSFQFQQNKLYPNRPLNTYFIYFLTSLYNTLHKSFFFFSFCHSHLNIFFFILSLFFHLSVSLFLSLFEARTMNKTSKPTATTITTDPT